MKVLTGIMQVTKMDDPDKVGISKAKGHARFLSAAPELTESTNYFAHKMILENKGNLEEGDLFSADFKLRGNSKYLKSVHQFTRNEAQAIVDEYGLVEYQYGAVANPLIDMGIIPKVKVNRVIVDNENDQETGGIFDKIVFQNTWVNDYFLNDDLSLFFSTLNATAKKFGFANGLLRGPSGYGKTSSVEAFAQAVGRPVYIHDCSTMTEPDSWFGGFNSSLEFVPSSLMNAIMEGGNVIVLDEVNRIMSGFISNTLLPLLDHRRKSIYENQTFAVGENTIFVLTANIGWEYVATSELDRAFVNRVEATVAVKPLPQDVERDLYVKVYGLDVDISKVVVDILSIMRQEAKDRMLSVDVSTRTGEIISKSIVCGLTIPQAFGLAVINTLDEEIVKDFMDIINSRTPDIFR